jgi:hypothetical protein
MINHKPIYLSDETIDKQDIDNLISWLGQDPIPNSGVINYLHQKKCFQPKHHHLPSGSSEYILAIFLFVRLAR